MMQNFRVWPHSLAWATVCVCALIFLSASEAWATTYEYDELNRLKKVDYENGASIIYEYDAAGNITAVQYQGFSKLPTKLIPAADTFIEPKSKQTRQPDGDRK